MKAIKQALEALQRCGYHKLQPDSIQNIVNHYIPLLEQAIATEESSATQEPKREPLTDEQLRKVKHHMVDGAYHYSFMQGARYAENYHGIKGEA